MSSVAQLQGDAPLAPVPWEVSERTRSALLLLAEALGLGVLGNTLFAVAAPGVNVVLWIAALLLAVGLLARRTRVEMEGEGRWMAFPALLFAAAMAWRGSPALIAADTLALAVALGLGAWRARDGELGKARIGEYLGGLVATGAHAVSGIFVLAFDRVEWRSLLPAGRGTRVLAVVRGVLFALPLLFVFTLLFTAADPVFASLVEGLFRWDAGAVAENSFRTLFWGWVAAGVLWAALRAPAEEAEPRRIPRPKLGITEVATTLALLDALFLVFVAVQFRYLFGGQAWVSATGELGWGEYARRGFFELVAVAALVLPVLLALHALLGDAGRREQRTFRLLARTLVVLLFVVMASAMERMWLYQAAYGLTELRLYTSAFMGWLALVFLWLLATVLRGRPERFPRGTVMAGFATVAALNGLNPDALIARTNLQRGAATGRLDAAYLATLSADAAPVLARAYVGLRERDRCFVGQALERWERTDGDWRSWNWSRAGARQIARRERWAAPGTACGAPPAPRSEY